MANERRNLINLARTLGYKVKPTTTSFVNLQFKQIIGSNTSETGEITPDFSNAMTLDEGVQVKSSTNSDIVFETLAPVDFRVSSSMTPEPEVTGTDADGLINEYTLTRTVSAIGGRRIMKKFDVGSPSKFFEIKLTDKDIVEIISITDSNNNKWHEVEYLAQDKVRVDTFYSGSIRNTAYDFMDTTTSNIAVPFTMEYQKVSKRFITQTNEDNSTSVIFGNGVLKNGQTIGEEFLDLQQVGLTIPGEPSNYTFGPDNIDIGLGDSQSTLGETPFNTTLTIIYRVAKGLKMNVTSGDITNIDASTLSVDAGSNNLTCVNPNPAHGASHNESMEEIRQKALAFFTTQNRCVTQQDYEARILNMPAKFGQIAKVFVNRGDDLSTLDTDESSETNRVNIYTLTYNKAKSLTIIPDKSDGTPHPLKQNLKKYISNYKMLTDDIFISNGYVINFGVVFDVIAHRNASKAAVKYDCIDAIKKYFNIDKMQFHQVIYTSDLIYELSSLESVRSVNFVELTQNFSTYNYVDGDLEIQPLYCNDKTYPDDSACNPEGAGIQYGWSYDFKQFYNPSGTAFKGSGIVLPSKTPAVFELKNPNKNIIGVVH
jgi:hypothetical protein